VSGADANGSLYAPRVGGTHKNGLGSRYEPRAELGRGGMAEVTLCYDTRVGREVAVKRLHPESADDLERRGRFLREARIQARVEHPGFVPVYDMSATRKERVWFAMRRVRGQTLAAFLESRRSSPRGDDDSTYVRLGRNKLLAIFAQVCRAVAYAHREGVVHRDLKPSNIMLGEFGEVYVLDWGVAKLLEHARARGTTQSDVAFDDELEQTAEGASLGTPGYMSPEQALGESMITPAADVYSLGCVLFELLTLERLNDGATTAEQIERTVKGLGPRIEERMPALGVPPELEALVREATTFDPRERLDRASELADRIDAFLEGDRDWARRRRLARAHVDTARAEPERARAELARALALDPQNEEAAAWLARLVLEIPEELPEPAREAYDEWQERSRRRAARISLARYGLWMAYLPVYALMGIRIGWLAATCVATLAATMALCVAHARGTFRGPRASLAIFVASSISLMFFTQAFSPLVVVPSLAATNVMYFAMYTGRRHRPMLFLASAAAVALPMLAERFGLIPPTFRIGEEGILIMPRLLDFPPEGTWWMLFSWAVLTASIPGIQSGRTRDALARAEKRLIGHNVQLRRTLPVATPPMAYAESGTSDA